MKITYGISVGTLLNIICCMGFLKGACPLRIRTFELVAAFNKKRLL